MVTIKTLSKVMKTTLRSVKVIIVDEVSMVSSLNFAYMHLRLNELFGGNDRFGSKNMLYLKESLGNHSSSNWAVQPQSTFGKTQLSTTISP